MLKSQVFAQTDEQEESGEVCPECGSEMENEICPECDMGDEMEEDSPLKTEDDEDWVQ